MTIPTTPSELRSESEKHREPNDLAYLHALVVAYASSGDDDARRKALDVADVVASLRRRWSRARDNNEGKANEVARDVLRNAFDYLAEKSSDKHYLRVAHAWLDNLNLIATEDLYDEPGKG